MYNSNNIFAKIIRKELKADIIYDDEDILAFKDVNPVAPNHILVVPKGEYQNYAEFISKAPSDLIIKFFQTINNIVHQFQIEDFRLITNNGANSGQSVFHFHMHIVSGKNLTNLI
ncbi:MAG: HIT domain-containing protein [Rickettsiaceae bacterium]|nr:HIT domain-containing protein [Rickettsiaceae bacterium]